MFLELKERVVKGVGAHGKQWGRVALRIAMVAVVVAAWAGVVPGSAGASVEPEMKCQIVKTIHFSEGSGTVFASAWCISANPDGDIPLHVYIIRQYLDPAGNPIGPLETVASGSGGVTYHCVGVDRARFSSLGGSLIENCT